MPKYKLLAIDGGGIRGIIPAVFILELEKAINKITNNPIGHISDYFDMIAGTSTGSILTSLYLTPRAGNKNKYTTDDAVHFYRKYGKKIFSQTNKFKKFFNINGIFFPKYGVKGFEEILFETFGDLKISELLKPCIITSYNIRERYAHFFTSHDAVDDKNYDFYIKDVLRAAAAAPTYFKPALVKSAAGKSFYPLVDGGLYANNPAICGYSEIYEEFDKEPKDMIIVSVGTGRSQNPIDYKAAKNWGIVGWLVPMLDIILNAGPDVADYQLKTIFKAIDCSEQYVRLNPVIPKGDEEMVLIDNVSKENIENLIDFSKRECDKMKDVIEKTARLIIDNL